MGERNPFSEYTAQKAEIDRAKENERRTVEIASILMKNKGFVGGQMEDEGSQQIEQEILGVFRANYKSVEEMGIIADGRNSSSSEKQIKLAKDNLQVLGDAGLVALNYLYRGYENGGLPLDGQTADGIDPLFRDTKLEGIGKYIADRSVSFTDSGDRDGLLKLIKSFDRDHDLFSKLLKEKKGKYTDVLKQVFQIEKSKSVETGRQSFRPRRNEEGEVEGGVEAAWQVTPEKLAEAMLFMDSSVRWQSYTPPEWFKQLDAETQARIEYMVMVCEGASNLSYAGKDLDKILGNKMYFSFDNEKFTKLFNGDFKLVMSKMLNDLCELYVDEKTGNKCLRYKEKFYKLRKDGRFAEDADGRKIETVESDPDSRADIDQDVLSRLSGIRNYKNELADFLAVQNGRVQNGKPEANYIDQMNAYTAWNLFYMFGDSSIADRMRLLPTYGGIICDPLRTLNMKAKAEGKLKISKGQREANDDELFEAELFGGQIASQVKKIMTIERDLDRPIDKKTGKKLKQKIISGEFPLFQNKMCYGFLDFVAGGRDLYKSVGVDDNGEVKWKKIEASENQTLATLLMDYAAFDNDGNLVSHKDNNSFSLGTSQVDFLNWWRDHMEMAALANQTMMGKVEVKSVEQFARTINDKIGMLRGVRINGRRLSYSTDPGFWANLIWGSMPIDTSIVSSDFIKLKQEKNKDGSVGAYSAFINNLLRTKMGFSDTDVDVNAIARFLGVRIDDKMRADGMATMIENDVRNLFRGFSSGRLERQQSNLARSAAKNGDVFREIIDRFNMVDKDSLDQQGLAIYNRLEMAIKSKNISLANQLIDRF